MNETSERERIEQAIAALEAQRSVLGEDVVRTALAALRTDLAALQSEERRGLVTVLFADVSGYTAFSSDLDAEDVQDIMHRLWSQLDQIILSHGGYIDKHIGDRVMAVWGVTSPQENDPERATLAALEMQAELTTLRQERDAPLSMRIGINTGLASIGHIASTGELNVIGDTVNMASRFEEAAPSNRILISLETYGRTRGLFDLQEQPPLTIRGKDEPVRTFLVLRARERAFFMPTRGLVGISTRTVGRDAELSALQSAYRQACDGHGVQWVTISGVAGIGKSRLLNDLEEWLESLPEQPNLLKARAWPQTVHSPYYLLRSLLAFRCQIGDGDPLAVAREKLVEELCRLLGKTHGEEAAAFIGHLIGFDFGSSLWIASRKQDSQYMHRQAEAMLRRYLARLAARPSVIFLEDMQWADEQSLQLLSDIFWDQHPWKLTVVGAARPPLWDRKLSWGEPGFHRRLNLAPLEGAVARELVSELLQKVAQPPPWLVDLLVQRGGGNPYFTEELVKWLIEQDMIQIGPVSWQVRMRRPEGLRVPGTVQGVLQVRLEQLDPAVRGALQRAAVVGLVFWSSAVNYIGQEEVAPEYWAELEERGLVIPQTASQLPGEHEYHFKHTLLRDVVYEYTLKKERQVFHKRAAEWLSRTATERSDEWAAVIAGHYELAGESSSASLWYQRAGRQAQSIYARETAIDCYQRALRLLPSVRDTESTLRRMDLFNRMGEMLRLEARFWEAAEAYIGVLAAANAARERPSQTHAWHRAFLSLEDARAASALGAEDTEIILLADTKQLRALRLNLLGAVYELLEAHAQADPYLSSTLSLLQEADDPLDDDVESAVTIYQHALEIAYRIDNLGGQMLCLTLLSGAEIRRQEYDAAITHLLHVIQLAEQVEWYGIAETHRLLGEAYLAQGRTADTLGPASQALTWAQAVEQPLFIGRAWLTLGRVASRLETPIMVGSNTHHAADCFANSEQQFREAGARAQRGRALLVWAKYESERGDHQQGEALWQKGTRILAQLGLSRPRIEEIQL